MRPPLLQQKARCLRVVKNVQRTDVSVLRLREVAPSWDAYWIVELLGGVIYWLSRGLPAAVELLPLSYSPSPSVHSLSNQPPSLSPVLFTLLFFTTLRLATLKCSHSEICPRGWHTAHLTTASLTQSLGAHPALDIQPDIKDSWFR